MATENTIITPEETTTKQQLMVHRIYVKNSQFEAALVTPKMLKATANPEVEMQVQMNTHAHDDDMHEAILGLQITGKHNGSLLWRIQLQQAGLYTLQGFIDDEQRKHALHGFCMTQLYPYACATAAELAVRGGFPPMYLPPMDFNALYKQQKEQQKEKATLDSTPKH